MKIGFVTHPRGNILKRIGWIGRNEFDFVDLFLEEDNNVPEKIDTVKVKSQLEKYALDSVGHLAWYLPTGSPVKMLRDSAIKEAERYFLIFKKLNVEYVTIHAYWPPSLFSDREGADFQIDSLRRMVKSAKRYNLKLMYEPIDAEKDNIKNVSYILNRVPDLYFHLDIGHANLFDKNIISFIRKFHKKLRHVHLHDNHGKIDEHLPLGKGNINFKRVIKELRKYYDGTITLEIFSDNQKDVLRSRDRLGKLWYSQ